MRYQPFTIRFARRIWNFRMTAASKWLLAAILISGVLGSASVQVPIYQIFCTLFTAYIAVYLASTFFRAQVSLTGQLPERAGVSETIVGEFKVTNNSARRPVFDVAVEPLTLPAEIQHLNPNTSLAKLDPQETATFAVELRPLRRGIYTIDDIRAFSTFPFDLFRTGRARLESQSLLVVPSFHRATGIETPIGRRYQPGGIALTSNVGESPEYIGSREYVPGEPIARLDFRSWARLGKPVIREYQEEYYCRIALVLDTYVPGRRRAPPAGFPELEAAISLAASVADVLSSGEYLLEVFAAGPNLYWFRAGRHIAHFDNLLEILACLDACRENPFDTIAPALSEEMTNISSAICVFLDWDESRRNLVRSIRDAGADLKVLIVRDGTTTLPADDAGEDCSQFSIRDVETGNFDLL